LSRLVALAGHEREVRVCVYQSWHHVMVAQVDDFSVAWNLGELAKLSPNPSSNITSAGLQLNGGRETSPAASTP
jgi:hypothetical protein